jgi:hypothetical protein
MVAQWIDLNCIDHLPVFRTTSCNGIAATLPSLWVVETSSFRLCMTAAQTGRAGWARYVVINAFVAGGGAAGVIATANHAFQPAAILNGRHQADAA